MDFNEYKSKFKVSKSNTDEVHQLAVEIYEAFGKKDIKFMQLKSVIANKGVKFSRQIFIEVIKCDFPYKKALFFKRLGETKPIWYTNQQNVSIQ
jgi:hypothetical protein